MERWHSGELCLARASLRPIAAAREDYGSAGEDAPAPWGARAPGPKDRPFDKLTAGARLACRAEVPAN